MTEQPDGAMDRLDLRDLLLHRLPTAAAERLEERLMLEEELAQRLRDAENDLLDDYARGALSAQERGDTERYVLTTLEARRRVTIARALHGLRNEVESRPAIAPPRRWRAIGVLAAACVAMVAILIARQPAMHAPEALNVLLLADRARGPATTAVDIASDTAAIRLQLEVPDATDASRRYAIAIADAQARPVYVGENLAVREEGGYRFVEAVIPAGRLSPGEYRISLQPVDPGASPAASFTWSIEVRSGA